MSPMSYLRDEPTSISDGEKDEEHAEDERSIHLDSWTDPFAIDDETNYIKPWCIPANHGGYVLILDCKKSESLLFVILRQ